MSGRSRGGAPGVGLAARGKRRAPAQAPHPGRNPQIGQLLQQGLMWLSKGQLWRAQESFRAVLQLQPEQPDALQFLGSIALQTGQVVGAINLFRRAVVGKKADPVLRRQFGAALLRNEQIDAAERQLRKSLKLKPDDPETLAALATCKAKSGQTGEAAQIYESLLANDPSSAPALLGYARLLRRARRFRKGTPNSIAARSKRTSAWPRPIQGSPSARNSRAIRRSWRKSGSSSNVPKLSPVARVALCHAAAKIANDVGRYDEAFEFAAAAGRYSRQGFRCSRPRTAV